ncbi:MAG: hypothetical protein ACREP3_08895 [Candidatus Binatia bacterium]
MALATELKSMDFLMFARASEGLTHFRGIAVSFLAMLLGGAFLFLGVYFAGRSTGGFGRIMLFICWIIYAGIAGTGVSATGIMLLDRARQAPPRSLSDALVFGFICFLKACVIAVAIGAAALLMGLVAAIFYFICKIPGIGPMLLFFTHPVLVLVAGLFAFFTGIVAALSAPALWDGDTVTQAIAKSIAILKERAVTAVLYLLVMGFVTAIILGIIGAVIVPGYFSMTGLAAGIVGANVVADMSMLTNLPLALMYLSSGASGHVMAMMLATAVLVMLAIAAALQVQLMGINLVYLGVSQGVDAVAAESMLKHQFDQARAKAEEAKQRAMVAAERAKAAAQQARSAAPSPAPAPGLLCPSCNSAITPTDAFCENCGHKLK